MREIKFRAWETDNKKMISSYAHVGKDGVMHTIFMDGSHNYKIMQYTGLKDKNGLEIYEGDIVNYGLYETKYIIEWNVNGMWNYRHAIENGGIYGDLEYWECEVIGNIYQNPELVATQRQDNEADEQK